MKCLSEICNSPKTLVEKYISGLKNAFIERNKKAKWDEFESCAEGASNENIDRIKELYPEVPDSLIELLSYVDGTYFKEYKGHRIFLYFLGSSLEEYPYYLLSSKQIINNINEATEYYSEYIDREYDPDDIYIDDRLTDNSSKMKWLHFSDCMNNGGTSQLFIDFSPSDLGVMGQVVMFLHDPDRIEVIADSFDQYLEMLINGNFNFIVEDDY